MKDVYLVVNCLFMIAIVLIPSSGLVCTLSVLPDMSLQTIITPAWSGYSLLSRKWIINTRSLVGFTSIPSMLMVIIWKL